MKPSRTVVEPLKPLGVVTIEGPDVRGKIRRVEVSRWSTDVMGCEVWREHEPGEERHARWFTTPGAAAEAAVRRFTIASFGTPPVSAPMLLTRQVRPTGWIIADGIHRPR